MTGVQITLKVGETRRSLSIDFKLIVNTFGATSNLTA